MAALEMNKVESTNMTWKDVFQIIYIHVHLSRRPLSGIDTAETTYLWVWGENERDLTQSYDNCSYPNWTFKNPIDNTKPSITQRLRTDLGQSVE